MMLYKLSFSNIKKSFKDYAIYFFTLILAVCIFYVFNSIDSQTAMLNISSSTNDIIELLTTLLSGVSVFVSFILGFLIIYASRFLIKKRKKEFAIYMTLGMSKRKISLLLLLETLLIGLISLFCGLLLGIFISQITSIFVANLFDADMTKFRFNFSYSATIKSITYFGIIYLIVMIFNTFIINKCKLIDLLQSNKKSEKIKLKNPIICIIIFIISIIMLSIAYYLVTDGLTKLFTYQVEILFIPISLGGCGTILFFWSISGLLLKIFHRLKGIYYKNLNSFIIRQFSSKVNTMVVSISIISIMLFLTLCILSSALSIKNYFNNSLSKLAPADMQLELYSTFYGEENNIKENEIDSTEISDDKVSDDVISDGLNEFTREQLLSEINNIEEYFHELQSSEKIKDLVVVEKYVDDNFTLKDSYGLYYDVLKEKFPHVRYYNTVEIMKQSDYNNLANVLNLEHVNLKNNEYVFVSNYEAELYNTTMSMGSEMTVFGKTLVPNRNTTIEGFIEMSGNPSNTGFIVVPDDVVTDDDFCSKIITLNYMNNNDENTLGVRDRVCSPECGIPFMLNTKIDIKDASVGLSAVVTFIGLYLGIIFLISSAAILALKELSDSIDNKDKYNILRNIGVDERQINDALFKQILIFFMLPLSLAVVHTIFGIKFCNLILATIGVSGLFEPILLTSLFLLFIYGGYFILTYLCSKNIIKKNI